MWVWNIREAVGGRARHRIPGRRSGRRSYRPFHVGLAQVVFTPAAFVLAEALDQRVGEPARCPEASQTLGCCEDRRVEGEDVIGFRPASTSTIRSDVVLEQNFVAAVVGRTEAAVDPPKRSEDETAPFGQRNDLFHGHFGVLVGGAVVASQKVMDNRPASRDGYRDGNEGRAAIISRATRRFTNTAVKTGTSSRSCSR